MWCVQAREHIKIRITLSTLQNKWFETDRFVESILKYLLNNSHRGMRILKINSKRFE